MGDSNEVVVETSPPPPRTYGSFTSSEIKNQLCLRLAQLKSEDDSDPQFLKSLDDHFNRFPTSYALNIKSERVLDVLLHQRLLLFLAADPSKLAFDVRFVEDFWTGNDEKQIYDQPAPTPHIDIDDEGSVQSKQICDQPARTPHVDVDDEGSAQSKQICDQPAPTPHIDVDDEGSVQSKQICDQPASTPHIDVDDGSVQSRDRNMETDMENCPKLEELSCSKKNSIEIESQSHEGTSRRQEKSQVAVYEVILCTVDKPMLLSQLSALVSNIGLNIREAHVFSTTDGYSLNVFVVDGWPIPETKRLRAAVKKAIARREEPSLAELAMERALTNFGGWEIDRRSLKIEDQVASGAFEGLHRGVYLGENVAVKIFKFEHETDVTEFTQEVSILREVEHTNIVRFIGACTKTRPVCIITEYMPGGSLFDYLRKNHSALEVPQLVKFAIDVSKGMEYLHQHNITHRDLKTANLLINADNVVKLSDFGIARLVHQGDIMTEDTGTCRWMAPEILDRKHYDQRADIYSFAIVIWELFTAKVPYSTLTPIQAAMGVRQGLRPEVPFNMHSKMLKLMKRCWDSDPNNRPPFSEITRELEALLEELQEKVQQSVQDVPKVK